MSIDLEWSKLDSSLANSLIEVLNRTLASTPRPSFIGPVEVSSLDFGTTAPDVELVDLRDIHRDFLEDETDDDEDDADKEPVKSTESLGIDEDDGFEWVSRRAARSRTLPDELPAYHLLPPHMRYGRSRSQDRFAASASTPSPLHHSPRDSWGPAISSSTSNLVDLRASYPYASGYASPMYRSFSSVGFHASLGMRPDMLGGSPMSLPSPPIPKSDSPLQKSPILGGEGEGLDGQAAPPKHPNLQVHMHILWNSNLRLTFTTSLLINYPSPKFMSLPIKLSVTGLLFNGEIAVAYEGERRRIHLCILDDLDPYCPLAGDRPRRDTPSSSNTPPEPEDDTPGAMPGPSRPGKPLPVGERLLPSIDIESEIGQADKHVLKNVTRVERFIQDVIRKTVEEELVFPNFHTLVLPDPEQNSTL